VIDYDKEGTSRLMELHMFLHISIKSLIDLNRPVILFVIKVRLIEMPF
jgi:hypothetical protein